MAGGFRYRVDIGGGALAARAREAAHGAAESAAAAMLARSKAIAPRRTGAMIASARAEAAGGVGRVSYGAIYARIQHDAAGLRHPGGGQAAFLKKALEAPETARALVEGFRPF